MSNFIIKNEEKWSDRLNKKVEQWIKDNVSRLTFSTDISIEEFNRYWKLESCDNEYKLYYMDNWQSTFKYCIGLDAITTIYVEYRTGFKGKYVL